jgi:hypothetical protein
MNRPHIERLRVQSYGCVNDATLELTPLHALIGPNDSDRSALRTITGLGAGRLNDSLRAGNGGETIASARRPVLELEKDPSNNDLRIAEGVPVETLEHPLPSP